MPVCLVFHVHTHTYMPAFLCVASVAPSAFAYHDDDALGAGLALPGQRRRPAHDGSRLSLYVEGKG